MWFGDENCTFWGAKWLFWGEKTKFEVKTAGFGVTRGSFGPGALRLPWRLIGGTERYFWSRGVVPCCVSGHVMPSFRFPQEAESGPEPERAVGAEGPRGWLGGVLAVSVRVLGEF